MTVMTLSLRGRKCKIKGGFGDDILIGGGKIKSLAEGFDTIVLEEGEGFTKALDFDIEDYILIDIDDIDIADIDFRSRNGNIKIKYQDDLLAIIKNETDITSLSDNVGFGSIM